MPYDVKTPQEMRNLHSDSLRDQTTFLRLAVVESVDITRGTVDVQFLEGGDGATIPITQMYIGPKARIGVIPEEGALCVVGTTMGRFPVILAYLPTDYEKMLEGADPNNVGFTRRLQKGEIFLSSSKFGKLFLGKNVELYDQSMNKVIIDSEEDTITVSAAKKLILQTLGATDRVEPGGTRIEVDYETMTVKIVGKLKVEVDSPLVALAGDALTSKGAARDGDEIEVTETTSPALFTFLRNLGYAGGAIKGKITQGSAKVKVG